MTLLDRLLGKPERRPSKALTALGPYDSGIPLTSMYNTPQQKAAAYLRAYKVGWFYKAESRISSDVAGLPWTVSDGDAESDDPNETTLGRPDLDVPFASLSPIDQFQRLMERPNERQSGRVLRQKTQIRLDMAGAAFWYLEGADFLNGLPTAIYGISPSRMWPSLDPSGNLVGWVMDKDQPSGGVPFLPNEILPFATATSDDSDYFGVSVVEAVFAEVPLTDLIARHTGDVLTTGGRLAGMLWPKDRSLDENEFLDAQRAWRNVASDPNAARRLLMFPEPMEYAKGASTPAEIGIPELAALNRDNILTAFPISPYILGVPTPGGLNSGEVRREDRRDYWEGTVHPRADLLEETIQTQLVSRYEQAAGQTFDFEIAEPNMDDPAALLEKVAALRSLAAAGFDEKESVKAVGLDHLKFAGIPDTPDPNLAVTINDSQRQDQTQTTTRLLKPETQKGIKARDEVASLGIPELTAFLDAQRHRVTETLRTTLPATKAERTSFTKTDPEWWDSQYEDSELRKVLSQLYYTSGRAGLQVVADGLGRIVQNKAVDRVLANLLQYGGSRIADINARTLQSITVELAEGVRRGYSIPQLIDGVPGEGFSGIYKVGMDNGVGVWGDARAEMIARTETMLSYNRAALLGYKDFDIREVEAIDGPDHECGVRNGQQFSVEDALSIDDHPNGTLDWLPLTDKSWHAPAAPVVINMSADGIAIPAPVVNIPAPVVNVPEQTVDTGAFVSAIHDLKALMTAPRVQRVIRDDQGRIIGVEAVEVE